MIEAAIHVARGAFVLDVEFTAKGGVTALFGPSGSGKTTILNAIAGLERPQTGRIVCDDKVFFDSERAINLAARHRRIGYVFQDALLFPHLNVRQNLLFGSRGGSDQFDSIVILLGLEPLLQRRPAKLSGGERQRVAIGRAFLARPRLLLMDEPLASLDLARRQEILPHLEALRDQYGIPILYVSHAVDEVARLADEVLIIDKGRIVARGAPEVALAGHFNDTRFDRISVLTGRAGVYDATYGLTTLQHPAGAIAIAGEVQGGRDIRIVIRATDVTLALAPPLGLSVRTALKGKIGTIDGQAGATAFVNVVLEGGQTLACSATRKAIDAMGLQAGHEIWCLVKSVSIDERWISLS